MNRFHLQKHNRSSSHIANATKAEEAQSEQNEDDPERMDLDEWQSEEPQIKKEFLPETTPAKHSNGETV